MKDKPQKIRSNSADKKDEVKKEVPAQNSTYRSKSKLKELTAPKRYKNSYILFGEVERKKIKEEGKNLEPKEVMAEIGRRFKLLNEKERAHYDDLAAIEKAKYEKEKKEFEEEFKNKSHVKTDIKPKKTYNNDKENTEKNKKGKKENSNIKKEEEEKEEKKKSDKKEEKKEQEEEKNEEKQEENKKSEVKKMRG